MVNEAKLLGIMVTSNLTWHKKHTVQYRANDQTLLEAYGQQIRSITKSLEWIPNTRGRQG